jgi:glutathione S-transferase
LLTRAWQPVDETLAGKDYLIGDFSGADIMLGHAAFMSNRLGCIPQEMPNLRAYVQRISERPAFAKAIVMGL